MRNFAIRLMVYESDAKESSESKIPAGFHVCEELHLHLATFMGSTGFRALLSRALALATAEVPWLRAVTIKADWSLGGLEDLQAQLDPDELSEGGVVLLAHLLGLLVTFIGENLTLRLVCEVWPDVSFRGLGFGNGGKDEKTKKQCC